MTDFTSPSFDAALAHGPAIVLPHATGAGVAIPGRPGSVERELYLAPGRFDFFQAMNLLEQLDRGRPPDSRFPRARREIVRFRAALGSVFPASAIERLAPPEEQDAAPQMTVAFFGLTGPSGVLPRHYTELVAQLEREARSPERHALRDWLDLFNDRLLRLFYQAWSKYRGSIAYARGEHALPVPDTFTEAVNSVMGLGLPSLRRRLTVSVVEGDLFSRHERLLAELNDLTLMRFSGLLAQRPRSAVNLEQLLADYFGLPVRVEQFDGQWLVLDEENRTRLCGRDGQNQLGVSAIAGQRVWDRRSKIRLQLGPLDDRQFAEFLPDRSPTTERKAFFLLCHLTRLYLGSELDFRVQLVLRKEHVPACRLVGEETPGSRLGWNSWLYTQAPTQDERCAVFEEVDARRLDAAN